MKTLIPLAVLALASPAYPFGDDCRHQAPRDATVSAEGARLIRVEAGAGRLLISGRSGSARVEVRGLACASRASSLEDIQLVAERQGSTVLVRAVFPRVSFWDSSLLHLELDVPATLPVEVEDGSGPLEIRGVAAATVEDGSGELRLERIAGDVRIIDGSGAIEVRDVGGSVVIEEDGSGEIDVTGVRGDVLVREDGSGGISVRDVSGQFTVERDGSGGITKEAVKGPVRLPSRR